MTVLITVWDFLPYVSCDIRFTPVFVTSVIVWLFVVVTMMMNIKYRHMKLFLRVTWQRRHLSSKLENPTQHRFITHGLPLHIHHSVHVLSVRICGYMYYSSIRSSLTVYSNVKQVIIGNVFLIINLWTSLLILVLYLFDIPKSRKRYV